MDVKEAYQEIDVLEDRCEMHIRFGGMWDPELTREKMHEMSLAAIPLIKAGKPIYSLSDFTDAMPQDQESARIIAEQMQNARHVKLKRVAALYASSSMKLQYKRVAQSVELEFFDNKADALHWLRANREDA